MTNADLDHQKRIRLHELLVEAFTLAELQTLCFYLGLDYEELPGSTKSAKALELITYFERRGNLPRLIDELKSRRPNTSWPEFAPTSEETVGEEKGRREPVSGDQVGGDKITTGDISNVSGAGIGEKAQGLSSGDVGGSVIQAQGDVTLGRSRRDEQYDIALNWEVMGKLRMRGFDLAARDLSGLNFENSDLRGANLQDADLSNSDLSGADLSGASLDRANLRGVKYTKATVWPDRFDPKTAGAMLVDDEQS